MIPSSFILIYQLDRMTLWDRRGDSRHNQVRMVATAACNMRMICSVIVRIFSGSIFDAWLPYIGADPASMTGRVTVETADVGPSAGRKPSTNRYFDSHLNRAFSDPRSWYSAKPSLLNTMAFAPNSHR